MAITPSPSTPSILSGPSAAVGLLGGKEGSLCRKAQDPAQGYSFTWQVFIGSILPPNVVLVTTNS